MKITKVEARSITLPLGEPYTIAYETFEQTTNILLRIETDRGLCGYGCAAPAEDVTGETVEAAHEALQERAPRLLAGTDPLRIEPILKTCGPDWQPLPAALAAVDMALHDLLGKAAGLPLWKLLGGWRHRIHTSVTIGIVPMQETLEQARQWLKRGFFSLKLKGGIEVENDIRRVLELRTRLGDAIELRFDANQGYSREETLHFLESTRSARLQFIEQPVARRDLAGLGMVRQASPIPVMADESIQTPTDALRIAGNTLADLINIKLMKVGGLRRAGRISAIAGAAGIQAMVGCMDESALGILAGLQFALATANVEYADLDGHLDLVNDPCDGAVNIRDGYLVAPQLPGLGFDAGPVWNR